MVVTINTDASFNSDHSVGGYAYWIVFEGQRIKRGGLLKDCKDSTEAEIKAIANALHKLTKLNASQVFFIIVNTDCTPAIRLITGESKTVKENLIEPIAAIARYTMALKIKNKVTKSDSDYIEYRHVKAHTSTKDKRSYVNDWCDKAAKQFVNKEVENIRLCQKQNSLPAPGK